MKTLAFFFFALADFFNSIYCQNAGLFESKEPLELTISGNIRELMRDKSDDAKLHPIYLKFTENNKEMAFAAEAKTRGNFRRKMGKCSLMPLSIQFSENKEKENSIFREQKKIKLVMPCRSDELVVREWLVYQLFNLFTENSFRVRLVKLTLIDSEKPKNEPPVFAFFLEEEKQMDNRNNMISIEKKTRPQDLEKESFRRLAIFEFMIGNTDWSVQYFQNIKLLAVDSLATPIAVPYDFDHAGIVDAPYARPAEALLLKNVRERRYRGFCEKQMKTFEPILAEFIAKKPQVYTLYNDCKWLDEKYRKSTIDYLDKFYETINDPKLWQTAFSYPCDPNGTGNVVIQGLKKD